MCSAPVIKPLGDNFQGHSVWPCKDQWFGMFWYKARIRAPKGERVKKFFPEVHDMIRSEIQHASRTKTTGRAMSAYFECIEDLKIFLTVYHELCDLVSGPMDHEHITGIQKDYFFLPRSEPWFHKHDTRLEGRSGRTLNPTERKELRDHIHATIQENLGDQFTVRGLNSLLPTYYVNWEDIEPVLAILKLSGADFTVTRAIISDKYSESATGRYQAWQ